jgi:hypothetical protein
VNDLAGSSPAGVVARATRFCTRQDYQSTVARADHRASLAGVMRVTAVTEVLNRLLGMKD